MLRWRQIIVVFFAIWLNCQIQTFLLRRFPAWQRLLLLLPAHICVIMVDNLDLGSEKLIVVAEGILFCLLYKTSDRRVQFGWDLLWFVSVGCTWFVTRIDRNLSRFTFFLNFVFVAIFNSVCILRHWKWIDIFIAWSSHDVISWQVMVPLFMSSVSRSSFTLTLNDQISLLSLAFRFHARSLRLRVWKY